MLHEKRVGRKRPVGRSTALQQKAVRSPPFSETKAIANFFKHIPQDPSRQRRLESPRHFPLGRTWPPCYAKIDLSGAEAIAMKRVCDLLNDKGRDVWSLSPGATVYQAIELMAQKGVGALLVMERDQLVGIVSERDYARKVILQGKASREIQVREIMSSPVICIRPELTIEETMSLMTERRVRHLPVVVGQEVVGVISIGDVVRGIIEDKDFDIQQLRNYIASA